ncbi:MAG: tetratricopeptide repeat protein, partial [Acidobacteriaceae bacterium]|nr:tetratricopeptide repeat protein [Acidobacteriaceae bacterium]
MRVTARTVCAAAFLFMGVSYLCAQVSDPGQLFHEAVTAQQRGDYSSAIQQYRELVKSKPDFVPAWINLGVALAHVGQWDEAVESYRSALALDPQNQQIKLNLGLAFFKK